MNSAFDQLFEDPREPEEQPLNATGSVVGSYQIQQLLADRPSCQVYVGTDTILDRRAALKVLKRSPRQGSDVSSRFRLEGRILARLRHPNIVQLYGVHELHGLPCLAMEFVDGGSLEDVLKRGPLPVETAVLVLLRISRAVAAAHRLGVIHRDLKPQNILIDHSIAEPALETPVGFIKVADFGIARMLDSFESLTLTGMQPGTALYMAPEQVEARSRDICFATDVFSIGALLMTMLNGTSPFASSSIAESLKRIVQTPAPRLRDTHPDVPLWLDSLCEKCLHKDPAQRFQNAGDLADELTRHLQVVPEARPVSQKNQWVFLLALAIIISALIYRFLIR